MNYAITWVQILPVSLWIIKKDFKALFDVLKFVVNRWVESTERYNALISYDTPGSSSMLIHLYKCSYCRTWSIIYRFKSGSRLHMTIDWIHLHLFNWIGYSNSEIWCLIILWFILNMKAHINIGNIPCRFLVG